MNAIKCLNECAFKTGTFLQSFLLLAIRLFWGYSFFDGGWGKLSNIEPVIGFFTRLGIPLPAFNAYLVGSVEFIFGFCLLVGFASRIAAIPLSTVMIVALLTAHMDVTSEMFVALTNIYGDLSVFMIKTKKFVDESAFQHLLACLIVFCFGAGTFSVDYVLQRYFSGNKG